MLPQKHRPTAGDDARGRAARHFFSVSVISSCWQQKNREIYTAKKTEKYKKYIRNGVMYVCTVKSNPVGHRSEWRQITTGFIAKSRPCSLYRSQAAHNLSGISAHSFVFAVIRQKDHPWKMSHKVDDGADHTWNNELYRCRTLEPASLVGRWRCQGASTLLAVI